MAGVRTEQFSANPANFSIGGIGEGPRSFQRYATMLAEGPVDDAGVIIATAQRLHAERSGKLGPRGRTTVKGLLTESAMTGLLERPADLAPSTLESAMQIDTANGRVLLVGASVNGEGRRGVRSRNDVRRRVDTITTAPRGAGELVRRVTGGEYNLVTSIPTGTEDALLDLLGDTFGWTKEGILGFQKRLVTENAGKPSERTAFFAGLLSERGEYAGVATAEALPLPGSEGEDIMMVESTEWVAPLAMRGNGAVPAMVSASISQVIDAYEGIRPYVVFAECNDALAEGHPYPPSPVVARKTGLVVPDVRFADGSAVTQVLLQNVGVNDGHPLEEGGIVMEEGDETFPLRNFVIYQLVPDSIKRYYNEQQRDLVRGRIAA